MVNQRKNRPIYDRFVHKYLRKPYRLHVAYDEGQGQPVVLLHGLASNSSTWRNLLPLLDAAKFRIIAIDLLGFGESPKPDWNQYNAVEHTKAIRYTLQKLRLGSPPIVVGHSMGSLVAVKLAVLYPRFVKRLVLCSMPLYVSQIEKTELATGIREPRRNKAYLKLYRIIRARRTTTLMAASRIKRFGHKVTAFTIDELTWIPFENSLQHTIENQTTIQDIRQLHIPIDIIYGRLDPLILPLYYKQIAEHSKQVQIYQVTAYHDVSPNYAKKIATIVQDSMQ